MPVRYHATKWTRRANVSPMMYYIEVAHVQGISLKDAAAALPYGGVYGNTISAWVEAPRRDLAIWIAEAAIKNAGANFHDIVYAEELERSTSLIAA